MKYIMEIRSAITFRLIDTQEIKGIRKYKKMCKKLTKLVKKHSKNYKNDEILIRINTFSYLIKNGDNYGFIVGLRRSE